MHVLRVGYASALLSITTSSAWVRCRSQSIRCLWFFSVSNDTAGWAELVVRLRPLTVSAIGLEPSGGYERGIIRALLAAGLSVRRINPSKLRQFARARGVLAKNDRLDARLIAEYVAIMPTRVVQRDAAVERL